MDGNQQRNNQQFNRNGDDVFQNLPKDDPLVDAGYGPMSRVPRPHKPARLGRKLLILLAAIVVVAGLVTGGVALVKHNKKTPAAKTTSTSSTSQTSTSSTTTSNDQTSSNTPSALTHSYTSNETALGLTLSYPDGWTVAPATTTASGTNNITVTSPVASFTDASGAHVNGKAVVTIRPGSAGISELSSGATAAQASVQIGYTNPAAGQHKYPFVTFIHLSSGQKVSGAFEEVMITGLTSFSAGQTVAAASLGGLDPIISVTFYSCTSSAGSSCTTPLSISNSTWTNNATAVTALNIFESLQLK